MNKLNSLILIFLILSVNLVHSSHGNYQTDSISAVLKSYANAFTTIKPRDSHQFNSPFSHNVRIRDASDIYNSAPVKSEDLAHTVVPDFLDVETNENNLNSKKSIDLHTTSDENSNVQDPQGPPDHIIPYSEHENPKEPQTRPNYTSPGEWAKPLDKNISLDFIPSKLYAQVRGTHTVKHLPREEAIKNAETDEEKINAARLKEVVKISKANTVYTEEGYEDAAYDHAGQIRDADFHEGFARKLNENLKKGKNRRKEKNTQKHKSRKNRIENFDDGRIDHLEEKEEARISKQIVKPEDLKFLKSALNKSVIDPKKVILNGISNLERDLKRESDDVERASGTEPYYPTSTEVPETESLLESKIVYETTTAKHDVFTVRPRKLTTTIKPSLHLSKVKIPARYFSTTQSNYNNQVIHRKLDEKLTPINYSDSLQQYLLNGHNQVHEATYQPGYFESQTVNPVIANPLAVATVNGHGPYLLVVSSPASTLIPNAPGSQGSETTFHYATSPIENVTKPSLINLYRRQDSLLPLEHRKVEVTGIFDFPPQIRVNSRHHTPRIFDEEREFESEEEKKIEDDAIKFSEFEIQNDGLFFKDEEKKNLYQYSGLKPPETSNSFVKYAGFNLPERKPSLPVTRLLPPAPLSVSEYTSFYMRDKKNDPVSASVISMMPIIQTIRNKEQRLFPFLFRKRRSTRDSENKGEAQQLKVKENDVKNNTESFSSSDFSISTRKFPREFEELLNSSPDIATRFANKEIENRFKNSSSKEPNKNSQESLIIYPKGKSETHEDLENEKSIEIDVPDIDLSSVFEKDEEEPVARNSKINTTKYPYYKNNRVARNTALKYIVNPLEIPRKTFGGMEFYNSRKLECEEIDPNLEKIVPEEKLQEKGGPRKNERKLHGLGDKLDCYKAKYFDENPLDNPLFIEKQVEIPLPPIELNPKIFASKILELPTEKDEYVIQRGPKNPEELIPNRRRQSTIEKTPLKDRNHWDRNRSHTPKADSQSFYNSKNGGLFALSNEKDTRLNKNRPQKIPRKKNSKVAPAYQQQVYEDVMGTIINLEKFHRRPVLKRLSPTSGYSQHHIRENSENQGIRGSISLKNSQLFKIDGLTPPSQYIYEKPSYRNNKLVKANLRNRDYSPFEKTNTRIFKRHIDITEIKQFHIPSNNSNSTSAFETTEKSTFRIVLPPTPEKRRRKLEHEITVTDSPITQRIIPVTKDQVQNSILSLHNDRRYGKFVDSDNITLSFDSRRKEPRYNIRNPRRKIKHLENSTTTSFNNSELKIVPLFNVDPPFSSSTLIPIFVKPDKMFISQIPEETQSNFTRKRVKKFGTERPRGTSRTHLEDIDTAIDSHDHLKERQNHGVNQNKRRKERDDLKSYVTVEPDVKEHKELLDFLEGDPPGYAKAFTDQGNLKNQENESKESLKNEESKNSSNEEIVEKSVEDEGSQENDKNDKSDDEETNNAEDSHETHDQPFERYSDRPFSPPENFEDDKYSDLGPRINKPYFYHPPFEVPEYEKHNLEKTVDRSDDSDNNHSVGTEDLETYVFPWEGNKEEEADEVSSSLERYEYPWERRDRKERQRKRREKLEKRHDEIHNISGEEEDIREASNTNPVYIIPSDNQRFRDKKSVNKMEYPLKNVPRSRFNNKYESGVVEIPFEDEDMSITVADNDQIRDSILEYLTENESSKPKIKSKTSQKSILNNTYVISVSEDSPSESKYENTSTATINPEYAIGSTNLPHIIEISNSTENPISRIQSRKVKIKSSRIDTNKSSDQKNDYQMSSTASPSRIKKRGYTKVSYPNVAATTNLPLENTMRRRRLTEKNKTLPLISNLSREYGSRRIPLRITGREKKITTPVRNMRRKSSAYPNVPTSTGKTVEHRSRVSKEEIITKTIYPDDEDDDGHTKIEEISSNRDNDKLTSENVLTKSIQIKRRGGPKNDSQDEKIKKKHKVEKVTITMEETPDRVYRTKEIDKDGVKGKFVTIIANNNSMSQRNRHDDNLQVSDAEMEEIKNRLHALDSTIQGNENLQNEFSEDSVTRNYLLGNLLQNSPLPAIQRSEIISRNDNNTSNGEIMKKTEDEDEDDVGEEDEDEDEDEDEYDDDDENDDMDDNSDDDDEGSDDNNYDFRNQNNRTEKSVDNNFDRKNNSSNNMEKSEKNQTVIEITTEPNATEISSTGIIKDPSNRQYFYVEQR